VPLHIPTVGESLTAALVWAAAARTLTDPASYIADVSGLETEVDAATRATAFLLAIAGTAPAGEYDTYMARITAARGILIDALGTPADFMADVSDLTTTPEATDEQGSPVWVTATHTTNEFDISSLFTTPLTGATRRRSSLFLDLTGPAGDAAAWTTCTIKVKVEIDGTNPRTVDKKEIAKADVAAGEEPGVSIDIPAVAKDVQVTMQFDVALGADQTIHYCVVTEALE